MVEKKGVRPLSNITMPTIDYDLHNKLKEARAQAFELCEHLEGCITEADDRLHQARMGFDDIEAAEEYLKEQIGEYKEAEEKYYDVVRQQEEWDAKFRGAHASWVWDQEAAGTLIHKTTFAHGPHHPPSYLMYDDGGNLIFHRDENGRYSSYPFWIENITHPNPIETLGNTYFSSKELRVLPSLLEELFVIETEYLKNGSGDFRRLQDIRNVLKTGYALYKIEKPDGPVRAPTNEHITT